MAIEVSEDIYQSLKEHADPILTVTGIDESFHADLSACASLINLDCYEDLERLIYENDGFEEFPLDTFHTMTVLTCGNSSILLLLNPEGWNHGLDAMLVAVFSDLEAAQKAIREAR